MTPYTQLEIDTALQKIETLTHYEMCRIWRFARASDQIYFRTDLPTSEAFKKRLFDHFGGFTKEISKNLGF